MNDKPIRFGSPEHCRWLREHKPIARVALTHYYSIGYVDAGELRACCTELGGDRCAELDAIDRLEDFEGTSTDVRDLADVFRQCGRPADRDRLLKLLRFSERVVFKVQCRDCGASYDQRADAVTPQNPTGEAPTQCGTCGSRRITVSVKETGQ
jgi:hypothetical protein